MDSGVWLHHSDKLLVISLVLRLSFSYLKAEGTPTFHDPMGDKACKEPTRAWAIAESQ